MSVKMSALVWESNLPQNIKLVMLAYADHADHDGENIFPSVSLVAWKTGYSERTITRIKRQIIEKQYMEPTGWLPNGTPIYRIVPENLPALEPREKRKSVAASPVEGMTNCRGGDKLSGSGVTNCQGGGDIAVSPEPSFKQKQITVNKKGGFDSDSGSEGIEQLLTQYAETGADITPDVRDDLGALVARYGLTTVADVLKGIGRDGANLTYLTGILAGNTDPPGLAANGNQANQPAANGYTATDAAAVWHQVCDILATSTTGGTYQAVIKPTTATIIQGQLVIQPPHKVAYDWMSQRLDKQVRNAVKQVAPPLAVGLTYQPPVVDSVPAS